MSPRVLIPLGLEGRQTGAVTSEGENCGSAALMAYSGGKQTVSVKAR